MILEINSDQVYSIGIVASVPQPTAVNQCLCNLPEEGVLNWEPGAQLGIYRPETFSFEDGAAE